MECVVDDTNLKATQDKLGDDAIIYQGGWAFTRTTHTEVQKSKYKKSEDGKFYFYPEQDLLAVFKFLHVKSSTLLKANIEQADSKAVIEHLKVLSINIQLRNFWGGIIDKLHPEKMNTSESSVLLMHVTTLFAKSKQQRIREQLDIR